MGFWNGFGYIWDNCSVGIAHALTTMGVSFVGIDLWNVEPHEFSKPYTRDSSGLDFQQTCQKLIRLRDQFSQNPVLFVSGEKPAAMLAEHAETLSKHFNFHWTKPEKLYRIIDKSRTPSLCRETGIAYPLTHVTSSQEDVSAAARKFIFPCIVKPNLITKDWNVRGGFPGRHLVAKSSRELTVFYEKFPSLSGRTIWQELIEGDDNSIFQCTALVGRSGKVAASVCVRKLRQSPKGQGSMCYGRTEWNSEVISRTMKLVNTLGLTGYVSAEFKYQKTTGQYYFIELNPRLPAYNAFFPDTGINLANLGYMDLAGLDLPDHCLQREYVYWMTFGNISSKEPLRILRDGAHIAKSWGTFLECQIKPYAIRAIYKHVR
ncbi:MAG TPA: ATP-grasp domain-containing protein [Candidatus Bathyarchaeia archaeon]|nr:ATP-grasp domain-containing protein [Candidatus Bathyarchaeia archaeon]